MQKLIRRYGTDLVRKTGTIIPLLFKFRWGKELRVYNEYPHYGYDIIVRDETLITDMTYGTRTNQEEEKNR